MEHTTIGMRICALRKEHGMTQQQLANQLNISNKSISRWERDESAPDLSLIPMLADIFGVTCDDLLRGSPRTEPEATIVSTDESTTEPSLYCDEKPAPKKLRVYTILSGGLILLGLMAALICYLGLGYRFAVLGFCLELAFCIGAGICQTIGTLNAPEPLLEKTGSAANIAILALTVLSGSSLIMNSSLDIGEILFLTGGPLASIVLLAGLFIKWFLICPDERLHSLRANIAGSIVCALIVTALLALFIGFASIGSEGGLYVGLILTPIEVLAALYFYRYQKKTFMK